MAYGLLLINRNPWILVGNKTLRSTVQTNPHNIPGRTLFEQEVLEELVREHQRRNGGKKRGGEMVDTVEIRGDLDTED